MSHPVFKDMAVRTPTAAHRPVPDAHGTAVASLMSGRSADFHGAAPGAELYAADVYCGLPTGGAADAVADAFSWLARERVAVINVSLVGPPNELSRRLIVWSSLADTWFWPQLATMGPPRLPFPASYPVVVGVTAVDTHQRVLFEAGRGPQVQVCGAGR